MDTRERISCPHCGEEIIVGAKKCWHCKKWLVSECPVCGENIDEDTVICPHCHENVEEYRQSVKDNRMVSTLYKTYTVKPLSLFEKFGYLRFLNPPHVKLEKIAIEGDQITVEKKKGKVFTAPLSEMYFKVEKNKKSLAYIKFMMEDRMTRFMQIDEELSEEEWAEIINHLRKFSNETTKSLVEKANDWLDKNKDDVQEKLFGQ